MIMFSFQKFTRKILLKAAQSQVVGLSYFKAKSVCESESNVEMGLLQ